MHQAQNAAPDGDYMAIWPSGEEYRPANVPVVVRLIRSGFDLGGISAEDPNHHG